MKKKIIFIVMFIVLALLVAGGSIYFCVIRKKISQVDSNMGNFAANGWSEGSITATGTTTTGMLSEELDLATLESSLYVEEVYIHQGIL